MKTFRCFKIPFGVTSLNQNLFNQYLLLCHVIFIIVNHVLFWEFTTSLIDHNDQNINLANDSSFPV